MPIDLEVLLSTSSHAFFPYSHFHSSSYNDNTYDRSLSFSQSHCVPRSFRKRQGLFDKKPTDDDFLSIAPYKSKNDPASKDELSYNVRKKKVSFADDRGFNLVEVREIPGAPKWADDVITLLIGSTKPSVVKEKRWKLAFDHPPWPDEELVEMLAKNLVALEHVSVKEGADDFLLGTVKVKNLAYEKKVFLRVTFDRWLSFIDVPCTYVKLNEKNIKPNIYDTFNFCTKIIPAASRYEVIEFCICFLCDGKEYWDNNGGINYRLVVEHSKSCVPELQHTSIFKSSDEKLAPRYLSFTTNSKHAKEIEVWSDIMKNETYW